MSIEFSINFKNINANKMKIFSYESIFNTEPWQSLNLDFLKDIDINISLDERANDISKRLHIGQVDDIQVLDILSLIVIEQSAWNIPIMAERIAQHWILSVLNAKNNIGLHATLLFLLHYHVYPKYYEQLHYKITLEYLKKQLLNLNEQHWQDKILAQFTYAILKHDANALAKLALSLKKNVIQLINSYQYPIQLELKKQAEQHWLSLYLNLKEHELSLYKKALLAYLNQHRTIEQYVLKAQQIFHHRYFSHKELAELETKTKKFTDIYEWLNVRSRNNTFLSALSHEERTILRCWLGSGHYYQLEKAVMEIAELNDENLSEQRSVSLNRYLFWTNYQQHILDYWLLIPFNQEHKYQSIMNKANVKLMTVSEQSKQDIPVVLLKFDKYYFIQPLVLTALQADLVMTQNKDKIEQSLSSDSLFDSTILHNIEPCLIHDHMFLWQNDMALCLQESFNIHMGNPKRFVITKHRVETFPQHNLDHRERLNKLEQWYSASKSRYLYRRSESEVIYFAQSYLKRIQRHSK